MAKMDEAAIQNHINEFLAEYGLSLHALTSALNEANISHYSAGGGIKSITFEIFPASAYVVELMRMISLDREFKPRPYAGFKDACTGKDESNPAYDFILYLRRWALFAEQVMQREGDSQRGIAAARAKLIIADLLARLTPDVATGMGKVTKSKANFPKIMQMIGHVLEGRLREEENKGKVSARKTHEDNYLKALAAAQGTSVNQLPRQAA